MAQRTGERRPFKKLKTLREAMRNGMWWGATGAGGAAVTVPHPAVIVALGLIGFAGGTIAYFDGAWVAHRNDDPIFDRPTTFLFDTVATIICLMLFVTPALRLDKVLRPGAALPGWCGFAAMFLSAFLIPTTRGLLCNLGLTRQSDDDALMRE